VVDVSANNDMSQTALLVIDAQESFKHCTYWRQDDVPVFLERMHLLLERAKACRIPIVQIFHVEDSGAFSLASGYVKPLAELSIRPDAIFHKHRHSALIDSELPYWLIQQRVQRLVVSGIRTEQCCETTARHAADCGYQVEFVTDATLTFEMADRAGRRWSASEVKQRTELVLDGRFANIAKVENSLAGIAAHPAVREPPA
jgi:nicotinamidase-related amidase